MAAQALRRFRVTSWAGTTPSWCSSLPQPPALGVPGNHAHRERLASPDLRNQRGPAVLVRARRPDDCPHGGQIVEFDAASQGVREQLLLERPGELLLLTRQERPQPGYAFEPGSIGKCCRRVNRYTVAFGAPFSERVKILE